jgi:O-methyltransferase
MMVSSEDLYLDLLKKCLCASIYEESAWRIVEGPMMGNIDKANLPKYLAAMIKKRILKLLSRRSLMLVRRRQFDPAIREQGLDWPCFGYTMIGRRRLDNIEFCVKDILDRGVPGDFIETGVWRGGSAILMRALLKKHGVTDRAVWCADSFEGLPRPNEVDRKLSASPDFSDRDYLRASLEDVQSNFARFGLLDDQVKFLKGWFRDTLPTAPIGRLALLRADGDLYESTMDSLVNLYHKISPGGYIIIDDYHSWEGCRSAVNEFREKHRIRDEIGQIDAHAVFWQVSGIDTQGAAH